MKYFTMEELDDIAKELIENPSRETLKKLNNKYNGEESNKKSLDWIEAKNNERITQQMPFVSNERLEEKNKFPETNNSTISNLRVPIYEEQNSIVSESKNTDMLSSSKNSEELIVKKPVWEPITSGTNTLFNENMNIQNNNSQDVAQSNNNYNNSNIFETIPIQNSNVQRMAQNNSLVNNNISQFDTAQGQSNIPSLDLPVNEKNTQNINQVPFNGNLWGTQNNEINSMMQTTDNFNATMKQKNDNGILEQSNLFFQPNNSVISNQIPISEPPKVDGPTMFGQFEQNFNNNAA